MTRNFAVTAQHEQDQTESGSDILVGTPFEGISLDDLLQNIRDVNFWQHPDALADHLNEIEQIFKIYQTCLAIKTTTRRSLIGELAQQTGIDINTLKGWRRKKQQRVPKELQPYLVSVYPSHPRQRRRARQFVIERRLQTREYRMVFQPDVSREAKIGVIRDEILLFRYLVGDETITVGDQGNPLVTSIVDIEDLKYLRASEIGLHINDKEKRTDDALYRLVRRIHNRYNREKKVTYNYPQILDAFGQLAIVKKHFGRNISYEDISNKHCGPTPTYSYLEDRAHLLLIMMGRRTVDDGNGSWTYVDQRNFDEYLKDRSKSAEIRRLFGRMESRRRKDKSVPSPYQIVKSFKELKRVRENLGI